jgi:hypothetical protein
VDRNTQEEVTCRKIKFNLVGDAVLHRGRILLCSQVESKGGIAAIQLLAVSAIHDSDKLHLGAA